MYHILAHALELIGDKYPVNQEVSTSSATGESWQSITRWVRARAHSARPDAQHLT